MLALDTSLGATWNATSKIAVAPGYQRNATTAGHVENGHARLGGFGKQGERLIDGIASTTLDAREHVDSIDRTGHSRIARRTPSSWLMRLCPVRLGAAAAGPSSEWTV